MNVAGVVIFAIVCFLITFVPVGLSIYFLINPIKRIKWYGYHTQRSTTSDEIYALSNQMFFRAMLFMSMFFIPANVGFMIYMINYFEAKFGIFCILTMVVVFVSIITFIELRLKKYLKKTYGMFEKR